MLPLQFQLCGLRLKGLNQALKEALRYCTPPRLSQEAIAELEFWVLLAGTWNGKNINLPAPITTDAGPDGWGGGSRTGRPLVSVQGRFPQLTKEDSTNEK